MKSTLNHNYRESEDTTRSKLVSVVRPNPFSTRRQRRQRRSHWDWSARNARRRSSYASSAPSISSWVRRRRLPEDT